MAAELNRASVAFRDELKAIEADLAKLNFGLEVEYTEQALLEEPETQDVNGMTVQRVSFLCYAKHEGAWGIIVRTYLCTYDPAVRDRYGEHIKS